MGIAGAHVVETVRTQLSLVRQLLVLASIPIRVVGNVRRRLATLAAMRAVSWKPSDRSAVWVPLSEHNEGQT